MTVSIRSRLEDFLRSCGQRELFTAISSSWLNDIFPEIRSLSGCDQGKESHSEGDAALHTSMVFEALVHVCRERLGREPDFVERLSALLHDWKKPVTRKVNPDGTISFPGHEQLAAEEVSALAVALELNDAERDKLFYLIAYHGDAHSFPCLPESKRRAIQASPHLKSLCALQMADAISCHCFNGGHLPVYWNEMASGANEPLQQTDPESAS
jgi:poly(A) polymerase